MRSETGGDDRELVARSILAILCQGPRSCAYLDRQGVDDRTTPAQAHQIQSRGGKARDIIDPQFRLQIPVQVRDAVIAPFIEKVQFFRTMRGDFLNWIWFVNRKQR